MLQKVDLVCEEYDPAGVGAGLEFDGFSQCATCGYAKTFHLWRDALIRCRRTFEVLEKLGGYHSHDKQGQVSHLPPNIVIQTVITIAEALRGGGGALPAKEGLLTQLHESNGVLKVLLNHFDLPDNQKTTLAEVIDRNTAALSNSREVAHTEHQD